MPHFEHEEIAELAYQLNLMIVGGQFDAAAEFLDSLDSLLSAVVTAEAIQGRESISTPQDINAFLTYCVAEPTDEDGDEDAYEWRADDA